MVFQGRSDRGSNLISPRNWSIHDKVRQSRSNAKRIPRQGFYHSRSDFRVLKAVKESNRADSMEENEVLKRKIRRIERQNHSQQRRLQQLENLVLQMTHYRSMQVMRSPSDERHPARLRHGSSRSRQGEAQVSCLLEQEEQQESDCHTEGSGGLTRDLTSLMEEFDKNGRDRGMVYGVTPSHSFADSDDFAQAEETENIPACNEKVNKGTLLEDDVSSVPLPAFITPSYEDWNLRSKGNKEAADTEEPQLTPQACFTTPVLLTSDALKQVQQSLGDQQNGTSSSSPQRSSVINLQLNSNPEDDHSKEVTPLKAHPFSNLMAWMNEISECHGSSHQVNSKERQEVVQEPFSSVGTKGPPGSYSPAGSSVSSALERVRRWNRSVRLPLLSPMTESVLSEQEANASDEEELVVDEAVSHSMAVGRRRRQQRRQQQRVESVCSTLGPCVPPNMVMSLTSDETGQVKEEDVMTEIAMSVDESTLIEDLPENINQLTEGAKEQETQEQDKEEEGNMEGRKRNAGSSQIKKEQAKVNNKLIAGKVKKEHFEAVEESFPGLQVDMKRVKVENMKRIKVEREFSAEDVPNEKQTLAASKNDKRLPAGSVVLAMVDEAGALVPLPQFQVNPQAISGTLNNPAEEDVDVETVADASPVLEAGDLASLLAQFEASEAVNTNDSDSVVAPGAQKQTQIAVAKETLRTPTSKPLPKLIPLKSPHDVVAKETQQTQVNTVASRAIKKETGPPVAKDIQQTPVASTVPKYFPNKSSQASPTHQNIKDALPKEIIEKIKATTKRKSTQMLAEPVALRKGRATKSKENSNGQRSKGSPATPQEDAKDLRVPPPLDHDYCSSSDKAKKGGKKESSDCFNKLPDYYTTAPNKDAKNKNSTLTTGVDDGQDDVGKKDSGVESGDVSDASVETEERRREENSKLQQDSVSSSKERKNSNKTDKDDIFNKLPAYMTDIGNAKPKDSGAEETIIEVVAEVEVETVVQKKEETKKHKRKLNLSEYRERIKSAQSSRCPSPALSTTSNGVSNSQEAVEGAEATSIIVERKPEEQDAQSGATKPLPEAAPEEEREEGELEGDSETDTVNPNPLSTKSSSGTSEVPHKVIARVGENTLGSLMLYKNSSAKSDTHWKAGSHQGLSSKRWSSSRSRSRSHSRSPVLNRRRHSQRRNRSSHKRRRGYRESRSSKSPQTWRRWSRSHSRSRSSSYSDSHSYSSSRSRSRSRSQSHSSSSKTRDRRGYWRRSTGRKRHTRSRSRSSSQYRTTRSQSRSPARRRGFRRSRSPHMSSRISREEEENRVKQVEERRVVYVGRISESTTKTELRTRFEKYGTVVDISLHFRERGDNYGFVTYKNRDEAYYAVEHGNDDPTQARYDLCFGGRRAFCKVSYSDLDAQTEDANFMGLAPAPRQPDSRDFDSLLKAAMKQKLR